MLQSSQVLPFFRGRENGGDWSQRELAEFYRVENALIGSGICIATDRGITDEGEPWFVFYRQDNEEVIVHFARIDGEYIVVSNLTEGIVRGRNFQALVRELLESHPYVLPKTKSRNQTVFLHPAALLAALVVTGYVRSAELNSDSDDQGRAEKGTGWVFNRHDLVAYSAIVIAAIWDTLFTDSSVDKLADFALLNEVNADHDLMDVSTGTQAADTKISLGDPFFRDVHENSLLAAATVDFEGSVVLHPARNEWLIVASHDAEGNAIQASSHLGDHDSRVISHGSAKFGKDEFAPGWHSDPEQVELLQVPGHLERAVAKVGSSAAAEVSLSLEAPSTSNSPAPASGSSGNSSLVSSSSATPSVVSLPMSQNVVFDTLNALHMDADTIQPIFPPDANLQDVIQVTLAEMTEDNTTNEALAVNSVQAVDQNFFDESAQIILSNFLHDTPNIRIETFGDDVLIVDMDRSHFIGNDFTVKTWTMDDGSTVSILGIVHDDHALA